MSEEQEDYGQEEQQEQAQVEEAEEHGAETGEEDEGAADQNAEDSDDGEEEQQPPPKHVPLKALEEERRKRQELEKRLEAVEQQKQPQAPQQAPQTIEEIFDTNPDGTLDYIDNLIATQKMQLKHEYSAELEEQIDELRDTRIMLVERQLRQERQQRMMAERIAPVEAAIKAVIPDERKKAEIVNFAVESGLEEGLVKAMLDPQQAGVNAAKFAKALANMHAKVTNPQTKRVSQAPAPITSVGGKQGAATTDTSRMSDEEWYRHEQERLRQKGRLY